MQTPAQLTPEEKIVFIEQQIQACEIGAQAHIECPYCGERTQRGDVLCCMTLARATRAIIQRQTMKELCEKAERIAEQVARN